MPDNPTTQRMDLSTYTEATRRAVYDAVVAIYFSPSPEEVAASDADPENHFVITYSPDAAGLKVYHELGRWLVTWLRLEMPADLPEELRRELLIVEEVPGAPFGILLYEI
jgi:hypothetical protein